MHVTNELLASVFADSSAFCGKEDVLHALLYHRLLGAGYTHTRMAREQALSNNRVDLVLFGDDMAGAFTGTSKKPLVAIEVKGGAYGNRNALKDTIDASGYCADMAKLKPEAARGIEAWFVCVDMPELGRAVSPARLGLISEQCTAHGLAFAYYCQGEATFHTSRPKQKLVAIPIAKASNKSSRAGIDFLLAANDPKLAALSRKCLAVNGHEANNTVLLYDCLRGAGFGVAQLSLETYFNFAAQPGSRMQERPDLVVFDADFDGRFNLYKGGNATMSNDQHKLAHIQTIFEVKGGSSMNKKSDNAVMKDYLSDIEKLKHWRDGATKARSGTRLQTVFLGVDGRTKGLPTAAVQTLIGESRKLGNGLIYLSRDGVVTARA
ncbi:MAG: hypothetical protein Q8Q28_13730 [Pseudomonadota bacterium]|nr:hypothetical protein [Pseudomonadota bacterium]